MCVVYTVRNGGLGFIIHMAKKLSTEWPVRFLKG